MKKHSFKFFTPLVFLLASSVAPSAMAAAACFAAKPLASLSVNSPFGPRFHPVLKIMKCHCGVDFKAQTPLPIFAVDTGVVRMARLIHGGGNTVEIFTDKGIVVQYMHLSQFIGKMGDRVAPGDVIGKTGNTGEWTTGPHLHFITKINGSTAVDPAQFICDSSVAPSAAVPTTDPTISPAAIAQAAPSDQGGGVTGPTMATSQVFPTMDGISLKDFLYAETHKRFMNPQWYKELENPSAIKDDNPKNTTNSSAALVNVKLYLLRELNTTMSLRNLMAVGKQEHKESIEARMASLLSVDAEAYSQKILEMTRAETGKSK